jgi:predicted nucleic acid-binding Zn ribbon protein
MPIYEYESAEDGEVISLLRSMAESDDPVVDPKGQDRTFRRRHSVFGVMTNGGGDGPPAGEGFCPCGVAQGSCRHPG